MTQKEAKTLRAAANLAREHGYSLFRGVGDCDCSYILSTGDIRPHLEIETHPSRPVPSRAEVLGVIMEQEKEFEAIIATETRKSKERMHGATIH
jgi:hypothetical protein